MNAPPSINTIESNLHTFADKYQTLLEDIHSGLSQHTDSNRFSSQISKLASLIQSIRDEDFAAAARDLPNAQLEALFDRSFSNNLKLNSDISVLKTRFMNLGILEADASQYL